MTYALTRRHRTRLSELGVGAHRVLGIAAIVFGLALGGAMTPASASVAEPVRSAADDVVRPQAIQGPFTSFQQCSLDRNAAISQGRRVTPCFKDPQGWFYQIL